MSTPSTGDWRGEVVSFGDEPARPRARQHVVVAAVALVVGFLAGSSTDVLTRPGRVEARSSSGSPVAVGPIEEFTQEFRDPGFTLRVFNNGDEEVEVSLVDVGGWVPQDSTTTSIPAGSWGVVEFSAPADCHVAVDDPRTVHLRGHTTVGDFDQTLPLPASANQLTEYHQAVCALTPPVTADELAGVWLVEEVHGEDKYLAGTELIRFAPDGTFVVDPYGELFGDDIALWGNYRLHGRFLIMTPAGSGAWGCGPDGRATWRASIADDERLRLALKPSGACRDDPWQVWIARRVLNDHGLPTPLHEQTPTAH